MDKVEATILDPRLHSPLVLVKAIRNGLVYGTKVRFPHALVMTFLFRSGSLSSKARAIYKATSQHASNLACFAFIYKSVMIALRNAPGRAAKGGEQSSDAFWAGMMGGYAVFARKKNSVNQQIVIYIFARVVLALAKLMFLPPEDNTLVGGRYGGGGGKGSLLLPKVQREALRKIAWPAFATLSWASVMWLFRHHPDTLQPSLRSSMVYIYDNAERWTDVKSFLWHNA
ncbi:putative peroxisomal membrane protein [Piedraia hortae CBS 480.64]|uniref:Putative peroxisomal membrane protein n=1 Tax=Piedraia hortae CBS 480.64 TaxID=1314780 RepID=A0A6A7C7F3_9PEZI|nr:putative peroxisomal membrane protein [Piedraia hortae CBS 480.64]